MSDKVDGQNEQVRESMKLIQRGHNRERERETETEIQKKCRNKYNIQYYSVRGPFLSQQHRQMIGQQTEDSTDQIDCN